MERTGEITDKRKKKSCTEVYRAARYTQVRRILISLCFSVVLSTSNVTGKKSALNANITSIQSFMQQGKPDNDILLYFPIFDLYAVPGIGMLEHFDVISPAIKGSPFARVADTLPKMGYAYDYISDLQISKTEVESGLLRTEGNNYSTLLIPGCKYIPLETFEKILKMAEEGARILLYERFPENVSGYCDFLKKNEVFSSLKSKLVFKTVGEHVMQCDYGKGKILMGDNIGELLYFAGIRREAMADKGIMFDRRQLQDGSVYFIKTRDKMFLKAGCL